MFKCEDAGVWLYTITVVLECGSAGQCVCKTPISSLPWVVPWKKESQLNKLLIWVQGGADELVDWRSVFTSRCGSSPPEEMVMFAGPCISVGSPWAAGVPGGHLPLCAVLGTQIPQATWLLVVWFLKGIFPSQSRDFLLLQDSCSS